MAELRIHDQSSLYFKSIRTGTTTKDIDVKIPDKSGTLITDTTLQDILNRGGRFSASQILKPDITETPLEHPEAYSKLLPIASYRTSDTFVGEHTATEWVASEQPDFSIILDSTSDSLFRDGWYPAVNRPSVPVYVKYRFISEDVCSPYSDALEFTTPTGGVKIPTLSVLEDGVTPTVKGSPFALYGDATGINHVSSSWEIYRVRDNKLIKSITQDSSKLTEYKVEAGLLNSDTEYKFVVTYHTDHPVFSRTRKSIGIYKTPESSIKTPTLSFNSDNNKYLIVGTPFVVNSGTDEHKFTAWEVKNATDAVVYTEPNSRDLTTLNLTGVLEPDSSYTVTAVYKGAKASSAKAVLTFRTPVETIDNLNKKITLTRLSDGGVELKMDKVQLATAEKLLYLTWTVQNYEKKVALEVRLDKDLDTKYGQDLIYTMTPAESWLKWFPSLEAVNPTLKLSAKGRVVGEKTILNYSTSAPFEYKPKIELGDMSVAGHTDSLTPLISITAHSGEDLSWITVTNATWELWKLQEGLNPVKVKSVDSNDLLKNRYNGLDYNTNYRATVVYNTNFGKYSKSIEFKSADIFLPRPNVIVESKGNTILIKVNNPDRTIPGKPEKSHGSTTWILYSNTGDTLWKSEKNTTNLTEITLPTGLLQGTTNYKVGVIFHSRDGLLSSTEGQATYYHRGIEIVEGKLITNLNDEFLLNTIGNNITTTVRLEGFEVYEGGVKSTTEQITSGDWTEYVSSSYHYGIFDTRDDFVINAPIKYDSYPTVALKQDNSSYRSNSLTVKLKTTSGIEKIVYPQVRYLNSPIIGRTVGSISTGSNSTSGGYFQYHMLQASTPYTKFIYLGEFTYKQCSTVSEWENTQKFTNLSQRPNYNSVLALDNVGGHNSKKLFVYHGTNSVRNIMYMGYADTNKDNNNEPNSEFNLSADKYYKYKTNALQHMYNSDQEAMLVDNNLLHISKNSVYDNLFLHPYIPALTLIDGRVSRDTMTMEMISPTTREFGYISVDTNNTIFPGISANIEKYVYYFNNMTGLDFPVNGQVYNVRFSTEDEIRLFFVRGLSTSGGDRAYLDYVEHIDKHIYYLQDNIDINQNIKTLHVTINNTKKDFKFVKEDKRILEAQLYFTVTIRDSNCEKFKRIKSRYPNFEKLTKLKPTGSRVDVYPIYIASELNGPKYYTNPFYEEFFTNISEMDIAVNYSWLTASGYMQTIPASKFKSLSEIRTLLGLTPTNLAINENDLTEWYVIYWRGRIFIVPNTPIATLSDSIGNKWKYLYANGSKTTIPFIKLDKEETGNEYKLTMPVYTDLTSFNSVSVSDRLTSSVVESYCKLGRLSAVADELGDTIIPSVNKGLCNKYPNDVIAKLETLNSKLTSDKILPFFELVPKHDSIVPSIKYGAITLMLSNYSSGYNYLTLGIKFQNTVYNGLSMHSTDNVKYKIDKIIFKLTANSIEGGSVVLTSDPVFIPSSYGPSAGNTVKYNYYNNSFIDSYRATVAVRNTGLIKPASGYTDQLGTDPIKVEYYIHFTEPNDSFIYGEFYSTFTKRVDANDSINGVIFKFDDTNNKLRSTPLESAPFGIEKIKTHNTFTYDQISVNSREMQLMFNAYLGL